MNDSSLTSLARNGLWHDNPALVQLLGLCPLLAVSHSVVNAVGLGLATLLVMTCSSLVVSMLRQYIPAAVRTPAFVLIIAIFATCADLVMRAYTFELYQILGIFVPLIVANCIILARAEHFAGNHPIAASTLDGLMMGLGFALVLLVVGALREAFGNGTLFAGMDMLFGPAATAWKIHLMDGGLLLLLLPPGAFLVVGFLIALKNVVDKQLAQRTPPPAPVAKGSKRVRATGIIE